MTGKAGDISEEMYHRIYRLIKKKTDPHRIAATLNISIRTVTNIISRLNKDTSSSAHDSPDSTSSSAQDAGFLDVYIYPKTRYSVIQLVGSLNNHFLDLLSRELDTLLASSVKAVAIRLSDVTLLDEDSCQLMADMTEKYKNISRFLAVLDPSMAIESVLLPYEKANKLLVFGTERAFEEAAFSHRLDISKNRSI